MSEIGILNILDTQNYLSLDASNISGVINFSNVTKLTNVKSLDTIFLFKKLTSIIFDSTFNSIIYSLPNTVTHIELPNNYNIEITTPLPSLKKIKLGKSYKLLIRGKYLPNLVKIDYGNIYNSEIDLPNTVKSIKLGEKFSRVITNLPNQLEKLYLNSIVQITKIPPTLRKLVLTNVPNGLFNIPNLKELEITFSSDYLKMPSFTKKFPNLEVLRINNIIRNEDLDYDIFPDTLKVLYIKQFVGCFNVFLPNLKELYFNKNSPNSLGFNIAKITTLEIIETGHQALVTSGLPRQLRTLILGDYYNNNIDFSHIPFLLEELNVGNNFNSKLFLKNTNIKKLILGNKFNSIITIDTLPTNIIELEIGSNYSHEINLSSFLNLKILKLHCNKYSNIILSPNLEELYFNEIPIKYIDIDNIPKSLVILTNNNNTIVGHNNIVTYMKLLLLENY